MKRLIRTTLVLLLTLAFLYLGIIFIISPIPSLENIIILTLFRIIGVIWFIAGVWILINIKKIHNQII